MGEREEVRDVTLKSILTAPKVEIRNESLVFVASHEGMKLQLK
jgi:hypothetical protein